MRRSSVCVHSDRHKLFVHKCLGLRGRRREAGGGRLEAGGRGVRQEGGRRRARCILSIPYIVLPFLVLWMSESLWGMTKYPSTKEGRSPKEFSRCSLSSFDCIRRSSFLTPHSASRLRPGASRLRPPLSFDVGCSDVLMFDVLPQISHRSPSQRCRSRLQAGTCGLPPPASSSLRCWMF